MARMILALLALSWCAACRADVLDAALLKHGNKIVKGCTDAGHKVVGVVRFQVRVPGVGPNIEPLSSNLASRVENLLVLADEKKQLKVIRGIGAQAGLRGLETKSISALFPYKYGLAWGKERLKPDAVLYGSVAF